MMQFMLPESYKWTLILSFCPVRKTAIVIISVKRIKRVTSQVVTRTELLRGRVLFVWKDIVKSSPSKVKVNKTLALPCIPVNIVHRCLFLTLLSTLGIINLLII